MATESQQEKNTSKKQNSNSNEKHGKELWDFLKQHPAYGASGKVRTLALLLIDCYYSPSIFVSFEFDLSYRKQNRFRMILLVVLHGY